MVLGGLHVCTRCYLCRGQRWGSTWHGGERGRTYWGRSGHVLQRAVHFLLGPHCARRGGDRRWPARCARMVVVVKEFVASAIRLVLRFSAPGGFHLIRSHASKLR